MSLFDSLKQTIRDMEEEWPEVHITHLEYSGPSYELYENEPIIHLDIHMSGPAEDCLFFEDAFYDRLQNFMDERTIEEVEFIDKCLFFHFERKN